MSAPHSAKSRTGPFVLEVPADTSFFLCQCAKSQKLPNCDASHRTCAGKFGPLPYRLKAPARVLFCGCRRSQKMPFCDDAHKDKA
jgi:CDGSH iron-sulfur domain-containing protein 3